jgi:cytochrome b561
MDSEIVGTRSYGAVSKSLHWLLFLLLLAQYLVGEFMPHIGGKTLDEGLVAWHLSLGAAILFFLVVRLGWRMTHPVGFPATLPLWEQRSALLTHWTLYILLLVIVVLGWAAANFRGWDLTLFGAVTLPPLAAKGTKWAHTAGDVHVWLVYVLLGVIALHVLAALYHYFIKRDGITQRMLPGGGKA